MNQLIFGLKREYWEYKRMLFVMPLIVSVLFFIVAMVSTWSQDDELGALINESIQTETGPENRADPQKSAVETSQDSDENTDKPIENLSKGSDGAQGDQGDSSEEQFWFAGLYLAAAWLAGLFYASACLYNDRRDKSILYWKTLPVPETQTVLNKMLFAIVGFASVAVVVAWVAAIALMSYAHLVFPPEMLVDDTAGMSPNKLFLWPVLAIFIATVWCTPVFAAVMYVSARANKMPVLVLLVILIVVRVIERVVFGSAHVFGFFYAHSPFGLLATISESQSAAQFLRFYLVESLPSLLFGLAMALVFLWLAVRQREHCLS